MGEGYKAQNDGSSDLNMDEFLCEYVDGTMDPRVQVVFEEYLAADPVLASHVKRLKETRALLGSYQCTLHAPGNFHRRLYSEMTTEWMASMRPADGNAADRLKHVAALTSVAVALALFGLLVGADREIQMASSPHVTAEVERPLDFPFRTSFDHRTPVDDEPSAMSIGPHSVPGSRGSVLTLFDIQTAGFSAQP